MANYTSAHSGAVIDAAVTKVAATNSSAAELNILDGVTATAAELNKTDGLTVTTAELNQLDDKVVGGANTDDIVDVASSQALSNKTLDGGTFI
jgi:hypothetical protein